RDLKSLLVGYYRDNKLVFAGRVGTGFSARTERDLLTHLRALQRAASPFVSVPKEYRRGVNWVEPQLVVAVKFAMAFCAILHSTGSARVVSGSPCVSIIRLRLNRPNKRSARQVGQAAWRRAHLASCTGLPLPSIKCSFQRERGIRLNRRSAISQGWGAGSDD